jgi:asparagine synthase (glutamine-hydrolysing)
MCGISGIVSTVGNEALSSSLQRMITVQRHRGPDGQGHWLGRFGSQHIGLGHNRLAVLDLTPNGRQPVISEDGTHVLVYNGEIYNFVELRNGLKALGVQFRSNGDAEVVLQSLLVWGEAALQKFNGMWAFAWLDLEKKRLLLSRDRLGEKPLYFYRSKQSLFFASEIKGILAGSGERFPVNMTVAARYLQQSLLDAQDETFFVGIQSVAAGHNVSLELTGFPTVPTPRSMRFWSPPLIDTREGDIPKRIEEIRETFVDSVAIRLRSDVPVGALLSGGIGSSSITGAMRKILGKDADLHLMSVVSDDARFNEEPFIDEMAAYLNNSTHKVAWRPNGSEAFKLLETVTYFNDEPVGDFSTVFHYLLMEQAKDLGIKVILSGQGDDELLCGYRKYLGFHLQHLIRNGKWYAAIKDVAKFVARGTVVSQFNIADARRYLPRSFLTSGVDVRGPLLRNIDSHMNVGLGEGDVISRQVADLVHFSIPTQCHYEDRMSMSHSREIRLPFLDYRMVELLLPLSPQWKLRDGWTKWIFRESMKDHMPPKITWRKDKMGFDNPQSDWLKKEFREPVESILNGELLIETCGLVNRAALQKSYEAYCKQDTGSGRIRYQDFLQPIGLEIWMRRFESHLSLDWLPASTSRTHRQSVVSESIGRDREKVI